MNKRLACAAASQCKVSNINGFMATCKQNNNPVNKTLLAFLLFLLVECPVSGHLTKCLPLIKKHCLVCYIGQTEDCDILPAIL